MAMVIIDSNSACHTDDSTGPNRAGHESMASMLSLASEYLYSLSAFRCLEIPNAWVTPRPLVRTQYCVGAGSSIQAGSNGLPWQDSQARWVQSLSQALGELPGVLVHAGVQHRRTAQGILSRQLLRMCRCKRPAPSSPAWQRISKASAHVVHGSHVQQHQQLACNLQAPLSFNCCFIIIFFISIGIN